MERIINFPQQPAELKIENYSISTYKTDTSIFIPVNIEKKIDSLKLDKKIKSINIIIDEKHTTNKTIKQNILTELLLSVPPQSAKITLWSIGERLHQYKLPNHIEINHKNLAESQKKYHEKFSEIAEIILKQSTSTAIVLIKDFQSYLIEDQDATDLLRLKAQFLARTGELGKEKATISSYENLCIYAIGPLNKHPASAIDRADWCGYSITSNQLFHGRNASHLVEKMIYGKSEDSDGDGIPDYLDQCNNTSPAKLVDANGCSESEKIE